MFCTCVKVDATHHIESKVKRRTRQKRKKKKKKKKKKKNLTREKRVMK